MIACEPYSPIIAIASSSSLSRPERGLRAAKDRNDGVIFESLDVVVDVPYPSFSCVV